MSCKATASFGVKNVNYVLLTEAVAAQIGAQQHLVFSRSADWQSAVSRIGNPPTVRKPDYRHFAEYIEWLQWAIFAEVDEPKFEPEKMQASLKSGKPESQNGFLGNWRFFRFGICWAERE